MRSYFKKNIYIYPKVLSTYQLTNSQGIAGAPRPVVSKQLQNRLRIYLANYAVAFAPLSIRKCCCHVSVFRPRICKQVDVEHGRIFFAVRDLLLRSDWFF